ncbi:hypothetical protein ACI2KE_19415 [Pseudomonas monteilii]|uniref:hypothetical protein n=1 Tax=Pseudomonas alabamensis TaxID=3064349 RepID=UPI0021DA0924|nr:hypothetical protein [Pseudomonas entomophila]
MLIQLENHAMSKKTSSGGQKIGRDADSGRFTTVEKARKNPKTHVVETVKKPK